MQDVYDDLNASGFKIYQAPTEGHATRYTKDQLMSYISAFSDIINFVGLVLLLTVYARVLNCIVMLPLPRQLKRVGLVVAAAALVRVPVSVVTVVMKSVLSPRCV